MKKNNQGDEARQNELKLVYEYLKKQPATATQVSVALGIYRPSLCRRKRDLEKVGKLYELWKTICPITKHRASLLTTNPDLFPPQQPTLFDNIGGADE